MKRIVALFVLIAVSGALAARAADSSSVTGWITDASCASKHAGTGLACAKKCIEGGDKPVFVDEQKKAVWSIDNPDAVKSYYGEKVTIQATTDSDKKSVHIDSVAAAK